MVLDQINSMKQQGMQSNQIIQNLKQQGISPKEINEALSQSEIKSEINSNQNIFPESPGSNMNNPPSATGQQPQMSQQPAAGQQPPAMGQSSVQQTPSTAQMEPSLGQRPVQQQGQQPAQQPAMGQPAMQMSSEQQMIQPVVLQPQTQDFSQYQEYAPEGDYDYPEYSGGGGGGADIETINDISSQLIDEKTKHFKKEVTEFTNFKKESHNKLEELDKRLIKIEDTIEDLKMAIIRKIGEYGEDIQNLSNEMKATQNSFAKIINPLTTNAKAVQEKTTTQNPSTNNQTSKKTNTKKADSFENYLR